MSGPAHITLAGQPATYPRLCRIEAETRLALATLCQCRAALRLGEIGIARLLIGSVAIQAGRAPSFLAARLLRELPQLRCALAVAESLSPPPEPQRP